MSRVDRKRSVTRGYVSQTDRERFAMTKGLIMQIYKKDSHDIEIGVTGGKKKVRDTRIDITDGQ